MRPSLCFRLSILSSEYLTSIPSEVSATVFIRKLCPDEEPFNFPRKMFDCSFTLHKVSGKVLANIMKMVIRK